ncbi:MAG: hypothetical protein A2289_09045 [Deltaproteobacteria bacterium RIFOXYA12_FULL_58_15]|nr:MAG: hypothetical protein A2289_09045 [Deltaproteobacteria bacterium RIFOXYA12_FULL_58_15]OGR12869.1 MAG: hypothetical protein A2341_13335 [Deltaproteobacteria bacterium RIFOXYB12_FULL_58_9]
MKAGIGRRCPKAASVCGDNESLEIGCRRSCRPKEDGHGVGVEPDLTRHGINDSQRPLGPRGLEGDIDIPSALVADIVGADEGDDLAPVTCGELDWQRIQVAVKGPLPAPSDSTVATKLPPRRAIGGGTNKSRSTVNVIETVVPRAALGGSMVLDTTLAASAWEALALTQMPTRCSHT